MRYLVGLLAALCSTAISGNMAEAQKLSPAEQEVVNVSKARMEAAANRDMAAWTRYVGEDCIFSTDGGTIATKAQMLEHYKKVPANYDRALDPHDHIVHLYGDTAIVNYLATNHEQFGNTDLTTEQRRTETFVKRDGSWLLIAIQWDDLPINHRKPTVVEGRSYTEYLGEYKSRPEDDVETVFVKDGKLWSRTGTDQGEWLHAGGDTFFFKDDLGSSTFSRDDKGRVTGYTYHRCDGQDIYNTKIK
jgi:ketosteroid isomerase-like protein